MVVGYHQTPRPLVGLRWSDLDLGTVAPAKTVQRVNGRLLMDDTKTEDSDNTIPLPMIARRVLLEHHDRQAAERAAASELWTEHDLVFPTSVGTPMEPRSLNRHFAGVRLRAGSGVPRSLTPPLTWSGWRDSNPRPLAPKASALPSCATPRCTDVVQSAAYATIGIPPRPPLASHTEAGAGYA